MKEKVVKNLKVECSKHMPTILMTVLIIIIII